MGSSQKETKQSVSEGSSPCYHPGLLLIKHLEFRLEALDGALLGDYCRILSHWLLSSWSLDTYAWFHTAMKLMGTLWLRLEGGIHYQRSAQVRLLCLPGTYTFLKMWEVKAPTHHQAQDEELGVQKSQQIEQSWRGALCTYMYVSACMHTHAHTHIHTSMGNCRPYQSTGVWTDKICWHLLRSNLG